LKCNASHQTWTDTAGAGDNYPINCVSWYEAFAFCIWDGGRLPTEAEWEYAAAGGSENRLYPWGSEPPDETRASYLCLPFVSVGSKSAGAGRWGHLDLAGSMWEWTFDWYDENWYSDPAATGTNVCNLTPTRLRTNRGGGWDYGSDYLRAAYRGLELFPPKTHFPSIGFRCARAAPG
jgi:formylglycine-generating enzyme required for sulfatase activity